MTATAQPTTSALGEAYADLDAELAATRRVLERFPDGKADWRPHEKSSTIGYLAGHVAQLPGLGILLLTTEHYEAGSRPPQADADTAESLVALFDKNVQGLKSALAKISEEELDKTWTLGSGGRVFVSGKRRMLLRPFVLNHLVHHRAQLGVYYRLLNVPVPSLYGPTADEPF